MDDYINYLTGLGADSIPHRESDLLSHSIRVAGMLYNYNRPVDEQVAGLFHSIYGTEFQMYKINVLREDVKNLIGERSEHLVNTFCTLNDRSNSILYGRGLSNEDKISLRWIEYCNIKDQDPEADILKEFEVVLTVNQKEDII